MTAGYPIIRIENIIASYFNHYPKKIDVSLSTISQIKETLEQNFRKQGIMLYIDDTRSTIISMLTMHSDLFQESSDKTRITTTNIKKLLEEKIYYFDPKIDISIRKKYLDIIGSIIDHEEDKIVT